MRQSSYFHCPFVLVVWVLSLRSLQRWLPTFAASSRIFVDIFPLSRRQEVISPGVTQAPFITELDRCWKWLSDKGVAKGPEGLIPLNPAELWKEDSVGCRQSAITAHLSNTAVRDFLQASSTPLRDQQRLVSSSANKAGAWLNSIPSSPELVINDADFILAVRHRLGLPCAEELPIMCACEKVALADDVSHFHSCQKQKRTSITARHDFIVRALAKLFRRVGAVVHIEPRIYGSERLRPDLDITFPDQSFMVDVAVTHPTAPSRQQATPLAAASHVEHTKSAKYNALARRRATTFLPFVMESYGAYGAQAEQVLKILSSKAKNSVITLPSGVGSFAEYAARTLSLALQKGNALVARRGATEAWAAVVAQGRRQVG